MIRAAPCLPGLTTLVVPWRIVASLRRSVENGSTAIVFTSVLLATRCRRMISPACGDRLGRNRQPVRRADRDVEVSEQRPTVASVVVTCSRWPSWTTVTAAACGSRGRSRRAAAGGRARPRRNHRSSSRDRRALRRPSGRSSTRRCACRRRRGAATGRGAGRSGMPSCTARRRGASRSWPLTR